MPNDPEEALTVAPSTDVGSERLAAALAAMDITAVGRALRQDYVIVPLMRNAEGETQTRVVAADDPDGERAWELCVFSSTQSYSDFLAGSPEREFAIQSGKTVGTLIDRYRHLLRRVVFDPAGPHPVKASADDVLAALEPDPSDDEVAWITSPDGSPEHGIRPGERVVGLDLALTDDWTTIDLVDSRRMAKDVSALVKRQLQGIPQAPVLRGQLTAWLTSTARVATAAGGQEMAFLTRRTETAAAAVSLTKYWHDRGAEGDHLDELAAKLQADLGEGDQLARAATAAGPFVRHVHRRMGPPELAARPIVVIDYWLEFPDHRGVCLVSFSTPHQDAFQAIALLTDNVILAAMWELEPGHEVSGG